MPKSKSVLIALSGLAGAGKSTAIRILERLGVGSNVYVGSFVTEEVARRGLPSKPSSEKLVREAMRQENGMGALADAALPKIRNLLNAGGSVLLDAVYNIEERVCYEREFGDRLLCLAVETSFSTRVERLLRREDRPLSEAEVEARDIYELEKLGLRDVISSCNFCLNNDGSLDDFEEVLRRFAFELSTGFG